MTVSASHVGHLLHGYVAIPAVGQHVWHGITALWHGLTTAATVGVAPESDHWPPQFAFLERSAMAREMDHL
jgi:hypothetical protein